MTVTNDLMDKVGKAFMRCWGCQTKLYEVYHEWEMPCDCGALNFVKMCTHCFLISETADVFKCAVCGESLLHISRDTVTVMRSGTDEEDIE